MGCCVLGWMGGRRAGSVPLTKPSRPRPLVGGAKSRPWTSSRSHALRGSGKPHNPSVFWACGFRRRAIPNTHLVPALWSGTPRPTLGFLSLPCSAWERKAPQPIRLLGFRMFVGDPNPSRPRPLVGDAKSRPCTSSRSHALRGSGKPHNPSVFRASEVSSRVQNIGGLLSYEHRPCFATFFRRKWRKELPFCKLG